MRPPAGGDRWTRRYLVLTAWRWFPTGLVIPVLVLLLSSRGLSAQTIGALFAGYGITVALLELPTGGLADTVGRRRVLVVAAAVDVVALVGLAVGRDVVVLAAAVLLSGVARALDSGPLQAWYVDATRATDATAPLTRGLSRGEAVGAAALGAGALTGGALASVALAAPVVAAAVLGVGHGVALLLLVVEDHRPGQRLRAAWREVPGTVRTGVGLAVGSRVLRRLTLSALGVGATLAGVELLGPLTAAVRLGGEAAAAGPYAVLVTAGFLATAAGSVLAPAATRLLGSPARLVVGATAAAGLALLGLASPLLLVAAAGFVGYYALLGLAGPPSLVLTHDAVGPAERATVLSAQSLARQLAGALTLLTLPLLAERVSFAAAWATLAALGVLAGLALVGVRAAPASGDEEPVGDQVPDGAQRPLGDVVRVEPVPGSDLLEDRAQRAGAVAALDDGSADGVEAAAAP